MEKHPVVSVITAAYNRSNVLRYAVESVIRQSFQEWELIVVGDACTDDSGEVALSYGDPRIRFVNLSRNTGDQSGPNNEGFKLAKGEYIAYISQDDLWFGDHLEKCLETIRDTGADWVLSPGFIVYPDGKVLLHGVMPGGIYDARFGAQAVASLWLLKKAALDGIEGWRHYRDILIAPSQDLLIRAWKASKKIVNAPQASAVIMPSAWRKDSYSKKPYEENMRVFGQITDNPYYREELLSKACFAREEEVAKGCLEIGASLKKTAGAVARRLGLLFGVLPLYMIHFILFRKRGVFIDRIRKNRGLPIYKK